MPLYQTVYYGRLFPASLDDEFAHTMPVISSLSQDSVVQAVHDTFVALFPEDTRGWKNQIGYETLYHGVSAAEVLDLFKGTLHVATHRPFSPFLQGATIGSLPPQDACAVSTSGGTRPNGQPIKGRFYCPPLKMGLYNSQLGNLQVAATGGVANFWANYMQALNTAGVTPAVWSRKLGSYAPIAQIRVGSLLDTIRSRRNALPEVYEARVI